LPDTVAGIALLLSVVQVGAALAPIGMVRRLWRLFELSPGRILRAVESGDLTGVARPYLGHMFFHINLAHYLTNLLAIAIAGTFVFRELKAHAQPGKSDASAAFIAFFVLSGLAAGFVFAAANLNSYRPMIGASGAAAGLFGACVWILVMRGEGKRRSKQYRAAALFVATLNIAMASYLLDTSFLSRLAFNGPSAWQAHFGGYIFGVLFYPLFERMASSSR
jgi:membrane associated rhomboid family serine protease